MCFTKSNFLKPITGIVTLLLILVIGCYFGIAKKQHPPKSEQEIIQEAIEKYKTDYEKYGLPKLEHDEEGMTLKDRLYGNGKGMPKELALTGVSIMCYEWSDWGDNSKCSKQELKKIKTFFEKDDSNWEEFDYPNFY